MHISMTLAFRSELVATINLNYIQSPDVSELLVVGEKGWASW